MLQGLMYGDPPEFAMPEKVRCVYALSLFKYIYQTTLFYGKELTKLIGFNNKLNKFKKKPAPQKKK